MSNYAILRRSGWKSPGDLEEAAGRSGKVGDELPVDEIIPIADTVVVGPDPTGLGG